jgi:hypothetical protein
VRKRAERDSEYLSFKSEPTVHKLLRKVVHTVQGALVEAPALLNNILAIQSTTQSGDIFQPHVCFGSSPSNNFFP